MTQTLRVAVLIPLAVGLATILCTIAIHAVPLSSTINFIRREKRLGHVGVDFWTDMGIISGTIFLALIAHLTEMALWGAVFLMCGEFSDFGTAFYHSAVNYTSLGYGDLIMTARWRFLGPLETANGMLLFGVSTAQIFTVIQKLVQARFVDLRE